MLAVRIAELAAIALTLGVLGLWCSVPRTVSLATENPTSTAFIDLRSSEAAAAGKPLTLRWQWRSLDSISRYLRASVIYAEDYNFYRHNGVDWDAIEHAVAADWNKGAMAIGGSTITQQLAKNLYLSPRRSMFRKMREVLIAYALEDHLSKQRILELYLNIVEWGDGVFGAEAAARMWFHHSAQNLTAAEAIRLAIALPNPIARAPNVHDAELTRKAVRVVRLLRMQGLLDASQERATLDELGASSERVLPDREVREIRGVAAPTAGEPAPEAQAPSDRRPPSTAESTSTNGEPASAPPATEPSAPPATEPVTPPDQAAPAPIAHPAQSPAPPEPPPASAELPPPVAGGSSAP